MDSDVRYADNAATAALLMEAGIALMRQNIARRHPRAGAREVDARLGAWLCRAGDRIPGDTSGPVRVRERNP